MSPEDCNTLKKFRQLCDRTLDTAVYHKGPAITTHAWSGYVNFLSWIVVAGRHVLVVDNTTGTPLFTVLNGWLVRFEAGDRFDICMVLPLLGQIYTIALAKTAHTTATTAFRYITSNTELNTTSKTRKRTRAYYMTPAHGPNYPLHLSRQWQTIDW
jgi:multisubunit Na+/H+ antiporter MnhF subunit